VTDRKNKIKKIKLFTGLPGFFSCRRNKS